MSFKLQAKFVSAHEVEAVEASASMLGMSTKEFLRVAALVYITSLYERMKEQDNHTEGTTNG